MTANIRNVHLGDRFKTGRNTTAKVVDLREIKSIVTGLITGYQCIAAFEVLGVVGLFEVPFSTVVRNRIYSVADLQETIENEDTQQ